MNKVPKRTEQEHLFRVEDLNSHLLFKSTFSTSISLIFILISIKVAPHGLETNIYMIK